MDPQHINIVWYKYTNTYNLCGLFHLASLPIQDITWMTHTRSGQGGPDRSDLQLSTGQGLVCQHLAFEVLEKFALFEILHDSTLKKILLHKLHKVQEFCGPTISNIYPKHILTFI